MKTILDSNEIINENLRMFLENDTLVPLNKYPNIISKETLKSLISSDYLPKSVNCKDILHNRNQNIVNDDVHVLKGIAIKNSVLKYLPTDTPFYISNIVEDNIATGINCLELLLILHTSLDNKWYYIQAYYYRGWIKKEDVLIISDEIFNYFMCPKNFLIVTNKFINIGNLKINMGVRIPYLLKHNNYYEILLPTICGIKIVNLSSFGVYDGYLPYTKKNIIDQSLKYINTKYSWGGIGENIDCSSFIVNIFKTFGLYFPRDTKEQEKVVGTKINLKGLTTNEKKKKLYTLKYPFILYKDGHTLLCIRKNTVIHAYGKAKKVIISKIYNSYGDNLYPFLTSAHNLYKN